MERWLTAKLYRKRSLKGDENTIYCKIREDGVHFSCAKPQTCVQFLVLSSRNPFYRGRKRKWMCNNQMGKSIQQHLHPIWEPCPAAGFVLASAKDFLRFFFSLPCLLDIMPSIMILTCVNEETPPLTPGFIYLCIYFAESVPQPCCRWGRPL